MTQQVLSIGCWNEMEHVLLSPLAQQQGMYGIAVGVAPSFLQSPLHCPSGLLLGPGLLRML